MVQGELYEKVDLKLYPLPQNTHSPLQYLRRRSLEEIILHTCPNHPQVATNGVKKLVCRVGLAC